MTGESVLQTAIYFGGELVGQLIYKKKIVSAWNNYSILSTFFLWDIFEFNFTVELFNFRIILFFKFMVNENKNKREPI